jgi:hypothetical protein
LAVLAEQVLHIFRFGVEGKIADVNGHELRNYSEKTMKRSVDGPRESGQLAKEKSLNHSPPYCPEWRWRARFGNPVFGGAANGQFCG